MLDTTIRIDRPTPRTAAVAIDGHCDVYAATDLRAAFLGLLNEARYRQVVDLSAVTLFDSTGLAVIVGAAKRARNHGGELVLAVNLESRPGKVLRITGVHKLIRNAATVDEALGLLAPDYPFVATVHRPGLPDVHLGFAFQHQAELACWSLTEDLIGTAHVEGTTVTWSPTPDGVCPQPPVLADAPAVASLVEQELADVPPEHRFPDLFSRLKAQEGYETASRIWRDACRSLDDAEADA